MGQLAYSINKTVLHRGSNKWTQFANGSTYSYATILCLYIWASGDSPRSLLLDGSWWHPWPHDTSARSCLQPLASTAYPAPYIATTGYYGIAEGRGKWHDLMRKQTLGMNNSGSFTRILYISECMCNQLFVRREDCRNRGASGWDVWKHSYPLSPSFGVLSPALLFHMLYG